MPLPTMQMPVIKDDVVLFQGGLDITTPNKLAPGHVRNAQNWQAVANEGGGGGYERIGGYERFSGQVSPSGKPYSLLSFNAWALAPSAWNVTASDTAGFRLFGVTSGAIVTVMLKGFATPLAAEVGSELYEAQPYIVINASGSQTFQIGETIQATTFDTAGNEDVLGAVGVLAAVGQTTPPLSPKMSAKLRHAVANTQRQLINLPPGSGPVLGVVALVANGVRTVYAWRNTVDGTAGAISKSTSTGWSAVPLFREVRFTAGGGSQPAEGSTMTKGAVTATIKRVVHESGDWATNTAGGRLIVTTPVGGTFSAGAATVGAITVTLSGADTAIALAPNGKYQFDVVNFSGRITTKRIYGVDGLNRGFEFDGEVFVPIETKAVPDTPKFVRAHHRHLVLGIGSSLLISGPGVPYKFGAAAGGMELATGDELTGMLVQPGAQETAALAVFGRNSSGVLYGTSAADFNFKSFATMTGALPYMQDNLDQSYVFDDRGVLSFAAAQEYGNFKQATLTANLGNFLTARKGLGIGSCVSTDRSQLRLFFSDGSALYLTIVNGRLIGAMPQQFYQPFSCVWSGEDAIGNEETFAGGANGVVYQLDRGSSFDGVPISHFLVFTPNFMKAPSIKKQFRNGHLEIASEQYAEFLVGYALSYGSETIFQPIPTETGTTRLAIPSWDLFSFDNFFWEGVSMGAMEVDIKGKAEAIQMIVSGSSDYVYPFRLSSLITHYNYTRRMR